ncbi:MAG: peptidoglycan-binding domain-containing protein [Pseudomonadota bacterium]
MLPKTLIAAAIAAALALVPATRASADGKDFIAGALLGGVAGAIIQSEVRKSKERERARARAAAVPTQRAYTPRTRTTAAAPKKTYRPKIPATAEGREIQSSLNYFGFDAGTVDGQVGQRTRRAISQYQRYMGYPETGTLTTFQQHLLTTSYLRAEAGGTQTLGQIAGLPDGTRGLLKLYRADLASGRAQQRSVAPAAQPAFTDL